MLHAGYEFANLTHPLHTPDLVRAHFIRKHFSSITEASITQVSMPQTSSVMAPDAKCPRRVFVRDLEILASVGIYEVELRYQQRIIVGLELDVADTYDGISERIGDVFDYGRLVRDTEMLCQSRHFKLIETLAEAIGNQCLSDPRVLSVTVRIEKPDIMPNCKSVGIAIRRSRSTDQALQSSTSIS